MNVEKEYLCWRPWIVEHISLIAVFCLIHGWYSGFDRRKKNISLCQGAKKGWLWQFLSSKELVLTQICIKNFLFCSLPLFFISKISFKIFSFNLHFSSQWTSTSCCKFQKKNLADFIMIMIMHMCPGAASYFEKGLDSL